MRLRLFAKLYLSLVSLAAVGYAEEPLELRSYAPGSTAHQMSVAIASSVNATQQDYDVLVNTGSTASANILALAQSGEGLAIGSPTLAGYMRSGSGMYASVEDAPALGESLRLLFWFPVGPLHVMTYETSGMTTLTDLRGKNVFLGPAGTEAFFNNRFWVEALTGLKAGSDYSVINQDWLGGFQTFFSGGADAYFISGIDPLIQVQQAASREKIRLLGLTQQESQAAVQALPGYVDFIVSQGRQPAEVDLSAYEDAVVAAENNVTYSSLAGVLAHADSSEEAVYSFTKAFWEDWQATGKTLPLLSNLAEDIALIDTSVPLHPGALRYYQEAEWTIPEGLN